MKPVEPENRNRKKMGKIKKERQTIQLKHEIRTQTPAEGSAYQTALRNLITEWVRQELLAVKGQVL